MKELLFFYGEGCPHCKRMEKLVCELEKKGHTVTRCEIWENEENNKKMEKLDCEAEPCGGVPFFINMKSKKTVCGEATLEELTEWAESE